MGSPSSSHYCVHPNASLWHHLVGDRHHTGICVSQKHEIEYIAVVRIAGTLIRGSSPYVPTFFSLEAFGLIPVTSLMQAYVLTLTGTRSRHGITHHALMPTLHSTSTFP